MTDLAEPQVMSLWEEVEPDPEIHRLVRHFGVEYEMLPHTDGSGDYCCEDCNGDRDDWSGRDETAQRLIDRAVSAGLCADDEMHEYHCGCDTCSYSRGRFGALMTAQEDGTVGVEFVSRILDVDDYSDITELTRWVRMMNHWRDDDEWMPDGRATCGNHIHVSATGGPGVYSATLDWRNAFRLMNKAYAVYDWAHVADGACGQMRGYNLKPFNGGDDDGSWLRHRDGLGTFEHRLWNAPQDPERLWTHVGLSVALTRWGFQRAGANHHASDVAADFNQNIDAFKRDVISHLPSAPEFASVPEVLHNLATY